MGRPVRRLPPALGTGAGPAATGRAGVLALWARLRPRPALHFIVKKTLTYLRRAYVSVYRYSLEVFAVSRNLYR